MHTLSDSDLASARVFDGPAALAAITTHWPHLYASDPAATPYQSPAWAQSWAARLRAPDRPVVLLAYSPRGRPTAGLALGEYATPRGAELRPLGGSTGEVTRPVGLLSDDPDTAAQIARALERLSHGCSVHLPDIPVGGALARQLADRDGWHSPTRHLYATVPLPIPYAEMSRATRRTHARRRKAWDGVAGVQLSRTRTTAELAAQWDVLDALHQRRHGGCADPRLRAAVEALGSEGATLATLAVRTRYVAAQLVLLRGEQAWSLATGMDDADPWRTLAPGHALIRYLADELAEAGYTRFTLGRTKPSSGQLSYKGQYRPEWSYTATYNRADQLRFDPRDVPEPSPVAFRAVA